MQATTIHPKVAAAGVAGMPVAIVLIWAAGLLGIDMTPEVAAALAGLAATVAGYLTPSMRAPRTNRRRHATPGDAGESPGGVLWTVFLVLAIVALVMWIL